MKNYFYWFIAAVITIASAYYQRISGPTYPESGVFENISYSFETSHSTSSGQVVEISLPDKNSEAFLYWKRFKTKDEFSVVRMLPQNGTASAMLPAQPPAGKLEYYVLILNYGGELKLPPDHNVVTRFKGDVPALILIPHIILIFLAMLFSVRTGIEAMKPDFELKRLTLLTLITLILGGMIFGPITQLYAFGELWTGVPFGYDLTDNKTLIALIGWLIAAYKVYKNKNPRYWVVAAALLMFIIFLIPHSFLGSELDYSKVDKP